MGSQGIRGVQELLAEGAVAEHLGQLGQQLQVVFVGLFRHQQHEQQGDRASVGRVEGNRLGQADEGAKGILQAFDAAVGNGDALSQSGGAELLPGKQAVEDGASADSVVVLEQQARLLESALLAARLESDDHIGRRQ